MTRLADLPSTIARASPGSATRPGARRFTRAAHPLALAGSGDDGRGMPRLPAGPHDPGRPDPGRALRRGRWRRASPDRRRLPDDVPAFALALYTWSFVTILAGTAMFIVVSKFPE